MYVQAASIRLTPLVWEKPVKLLEESVAWGRPHDPGAGERVSERPEKGLTVEGKQTRS